MNEKNSIQFARDLQTGAISRANNNQAQTHNVYLKAIEIWQESVTSDNITDDPFNNGEDDRKI